MASTPSASALSAVLRCRGNIWTRNPQTKRPATAAYSLGLPGGSPAERSRSKQASAWETFLQGDRVLVGTSLTVAYKSSRVNGNILRGKDSREINTLCHPKLSQSPGDARSAVHGVQNALVRQLARTLSSNLPGLDKCSQIIQKIKYDTYAAHISNKVFVQEPRELQYFKVSITSPCLLGTAGQIPSLVVTGWSALKSTCCSLTALLSQFVFLKLVVLWRSSSSPGDAPQQPNIKNIVLQENGQIHSPTDFPCSEDNSSSGQMIPEDRPD
ncbi:uncharacterized protein LOC131976025 [Centropristis striata]|uniref:uncharacterized protein LOC131976025 n=1 Tax=Centropristis striata TaxID=184440 RepID=UPI0027E14372|nr:uncharacterized protein LOC131976025 [Centropristis striata]